MRVNMETESLNDILNGTNEPEPAAEETPQPEPIADIPENTGDRPRDEKGRFAPKGDDTPPEPPAAEGAPPAPEDDTPTVPRKALQDERSKRQTLEQQLAEMNARLETLTRVPPPPPTPPPSIWDDEQGWQQQFGQEVISTAVQQASLNARLDMSEMMVRQSNPDFEDVKAEFVEQMKTVPGLQQRALQDPHPWNFAYQYVKNQQRMQELQAVDVADLEAKLREKIRAELAAEGQAALQSLPASLPPSLAAERNVGSRSGPAWAGPKHLNEILS